VHYLEKEKTILSPLVATNKAIVGYDNKTEHIIVAIRGTYKPATIEGLLNVLEDMFMFPTPYYL